MSQIEWCEIGGNPSDDERAVVLAALDEYLRAQAGSPGPTWGDTPVTRGTPEPAKSWSGAGPWNGIPSAP